MRDLFAGRFGWVLTLAVVIAALAGFALWRESGGPELEDRSGLVRQWRLLAHDEVRSWAAPGTGKVGVAVSGEGRVVDVYWSARPCATKPRLEVAGTAAAVTVTVDRRDTGACSDSSEPYQVHMVFATVVSPKALTAELRG